MIRFIIWARLKDHTGWKASEVLFGGRHASDYVRWKVMKLVYEKDLSIYARWKAMKLVYEKDWSVKDFEKYEKKQLKEWEAE